MVKYTVIIDSSHAAVFCRPKTLKPLISIDVFTPPCWNLPFYSFSMS